MSDPHGPIWVKSSLPPTEEILMSEIDLIVDQLKRALDGEAWHGPALMEILEGVDAASAASRPLSSAHSIWELVLHLTGWENVIIRRIVTGKPAELSDAENFGGAITDQSETAWRNAVSKLIQKHSELIKTASSLPEARLNDPVPGRDYNNRFMLLGAVQHVAYHSGQIALLKKS
jgi:uncharacterized damage-inducible protein DinB